MATIKSGASSDLLTIDATSKAARVTLYDSAGREISIQGKATYVAANTFTPVATPTDMVVITGSATKTVRVLSVNLVTTTTAAGSIQVFVIKRNSADSGGTSFNATLVPMDSNDPAATAVVAHYTGNPSLGGQVGTINVLRLGTPVAVPGSFAGVVEDAGKELLPWNNNSVLDKPVTLRGTGEQLVINFNGAALVSGQTHAFRVVLIEE